MAITIEDEFARITSNKALDNRVERWAWLYLQNKGFNLDFSKFGVPGSRDFIASIILRMGFEHEIQRKSKELILPHICTSWIEKESKRQTEWILSYMRANSFPLSFSNLTPRLYGTDLIICLIDIYDIDPNSKATLIKSIEFAWKNHIANDYIYKWFKEKEEESRCSTAWEWFKEKRELLTAFQDPVSSYQELLIFTDKFIGSISEKILDVNAIKKRWNQKKYRNSLKGKKQYNFVLSDRAIEHLDNLSRIHDLKRTEILEIIIRMEAEQGNYIAQRMKILKNL